MTQTLQHSKNFINLRVYTVLTGVIFGNLLQQARKRTDDCKRDLSL